MGKSEVDVKIEAAYVSDDIDEDGLVHALEKFGVF